MKIETEYFQSFKQRFQAKIEKKGKNDCWLWKACKNSKGYGHIRFKRKTNLAHHISWLIHFGDFSEYKKNKNVLMHLCNEPSCQNPRHLIWGTPAQNTAQMMIQKRNYAGEPKYGEKNGMTKITTALATEIKRQLYLKPAIQIAKDLNISKHIIYDIRKDRTWRHIKVDNPLNLSLYKDRPYKRGSNNNSAKLTEQQAREIKIRLLNGEHQRKVGKEFGISQATAWAIKVGKTWRHL